MNKVHCLAFIMTLRMWSRLTMKSNYLTLTSPTAQVLASLPEIDNRSLVLPGLGPGSCGVMGLDTLWEEYSAAEPSSLLNYATAAGAAASPPDHNSTWASVLPLDESTNQRVQSRYNSYFDGRVATNSGSIHRVPFTSSPFGPTHNTRVTSTSHEAVTVVDPSAVVSSFPSSAAHGRTRPDTSGYLGAILPFWIYPWNAFNEDHSRLKRNALMGGLMAEITQILICCILQLWVKNQSAVIMQKFKYSTVMFASFGKIRY